MTEDDRLIGELDKRQNGMAEEVRFTRRTKRRKMKEDIKTGRRWQKARSIRLQKSLPIGNGNMISNEPGFTRRPYQ